MNDDLQPEQRVSDLLMYIAPYRAPDRLRTDIRCIASSSRQRPRWLALIKEPPMRISNRVAVGSPTFRLAAILALSVALLLAVAGAVTAGASLLPKTPLPAPFGPAANGSLAYSAKGDIYLADADGGNPRANHHG